MATASRAGGQGAPQPMDGCQIGIMYMLHFAAPGPGGARHYLGWTTDLFARLRRHAQGRGARLTAAMRALGITGELVLYLPGCTKAQERRMHLRHQHARMCRICRRAALDRHAQEERHRRAALRTRTAVCH